MIQSLTANFLKLLSFLRITDRQKLSLTNIAMMVVIVKLAMTNNASVGDLATLSATLVNYMFKRYMYTREVTKEITAPETGLASLRSEIKDVKDNLSALNIAAGLKQLR